MKYLALIILLFLSIACTESRIKNVELKTFEDSVSYAIGIDMAHKLKTQEINVNSDAFVEGFMNVALNDSLIIEKEEAQKIIARY